MAVANLTAATLPYAPPMARSGYGKRDAPDQLPRKRDDFEHLPQREAYLAGFIDRLPEGALMDIKTLAAQQPFYGQQAVGTALRNLTTAGHLRRAHDRVGPHRTQWAYRTHFSRTPRDAAWWDSVLAGESPPDDPEPPHPVRNRASRSAAYAVLARLGHTAPRMTLSAIECDRLEPLAAEWLARGSTTHHLTHALTTGLPDPIHNAGALARRRLTDKMPPEPVYGDHLHNDPTINVLVECATCGRPGRPQHLPKGLCRPCLTEHEAEVEAAHAAGTPE